MDSKHCKYEEGKDCMCPTVEDLAAIWKECEMEEKAEDKSNKEETVGEKEEDKSNKEQKVGEKELEKYVLKPLLGLYCSSDAFTPFEAPRATQTTVALNLVRADGRDLQYGDRSTEVHPKILKRWLDDSKWFNVPKPGEDDVVLHEMHRKYFVHDKLPEDKVEKLLFPRPYTLDIDFLNEYRRRGFEKCIPECNRNCLDKPDTGSARKAEDNKPEVDTSQEEVDKTTCGKPAHKEEPEPMKLRWKQEVKLAAEERDWCQRRLLMNEVGLPFKHDACKFYHKYYPPTKCELTKIKFSK